MTSKNASKTGSTTGIVVKPQKGTTLKVKTASNVSGKPLCVLSHQSGNFLTTPRISFPIHKLQIMQKNAHNIYSSRNGFSI